MARKYPVFGIYRRIKQFFAAEVYEIVGQQRGTLENDGYRKIFSGREGAE